MVLSSDDVLFVLLDCNRVLEVCFEFEVNGEVVLSFVHVINDV